MNNRSFCGILLSQPQRVAEAMLSTSLGVATEMEFLMQEHSTLPLFSLQPETKEIPLTQGYVAIVDASDYAYLSQFKWQVLKTPSGVCYAVRNYHLPNGKWTSRRMHREIMCPLPDEQVDHINGDGLNNTRANLRTCNHQQNHFNQAPHRNSTSKFKGVFWNRGEKKWEAHIMLNGKRTNIGRYHDETEAARAYDKAAKELFGEFARLNLEDTNE